MYKVSDPSNEVSPTKIHPTCPRHLETLDLYKKSRKLKPMI